jgi:TonB-dependent receptor
MKKILRFAFIVLGSVLLFSNIHAQSGTIRGRISGTDQLPLPGAQVYIPSLGKGAVSDMNGNYFLLNVKEGSHELKVSYIGYNEVKQTVVLQSSQTLVANFELSPGLDIEGVVVTANLQGQSKALNQQKNNPNITNVISSDQVGKFPDENIGDALKRIPGINVQYDQGEARFGNVRGTAPQLSTVMINGERIPSAEAEIRTVQLDLVPSDMVQSIEVTKAVTPDMDADAIGGAINLVTRSAPFGRRISGSLGSGYNFVAQKPMLTGSLVLADRFAQGRLGVVLSASYHDHLNGSENYELEWAYEDDNDNDKYDEGEKVFADEIEYRQYYVQRIRQSYAAALDFVVNEKHTLYFSSIYNHRNDFENRFRLRHRKMNEDGTESGELVRQTKFGVEDNKFARLEDQRAMTFSLGGDHLFGKLRTQWSASYAKASEERPNERYLAFVVEDAPTETFIDDPKKPYINVTDPAMADLGSGWELDELTDQYQYTEDVDRNARLDFTLPVFGGERSGNLKFGVRYRSKAKERDNYFYEYSPLDEDGFTSDALSNIKEVGRGDFLPGEEYVLGQFVDPEWSGKVDLEDETQFEKELVLEEEAGDFNASEDITAAYVMLDQNFGKKLKLLVGGRLEMTSMEYQGYVYDADDDVLTQSEKKSDDYSNFLPGAHLRYSPVENFNIRLAWTNTIARPNYFDLVPYQQIFREDEEMSIGNPELKPTESVNLDLMVERYFRNIGVISGGVFRKQITDFIVNEISDVEGGNYDGFELTQPKNAGNANLTGIEFAFQRQLDFLPGFLKGLGIYANYTYTQSEVTDFNLGDRDGESIPLPGSPENSVNASLSYDVKNLTVRLSLNYASDFIDEVGEEAFMDRYYDQVTYLDANVNYTLNDKLNLYLNANNLTNQPLRYYQGISERTMQAEYYNMRLGFGVKFNL